MAAISNPNSDHESVPSPLYFALLWVCLLLLYLCFLLFSSIFRMMTDKISLHESLIVNLNLNDSSKRNVRPVNSGDSVAKQHRNSGEPYIGRTKNPTPGKIAPNVAKVCGVRCQEEGCIIVTVGQKQELFEEYWRIGDYAIQRTYLRGMIEHEISPSRTYFLYHVKIEGKNRRLCKTTFMDIFQVTKDQVQTLQTKALGNVNIVVDLRGTHSNHPTLPRELNCDRRHKLQ